MAMGFEYPPNFRVSEDYTLGTRLIDYGVFIDLDQSEGIPSRWIAFYKDSKTPRWSNSWLDKLSNVNIGNTILLENATENQKEFSTLQRISDISINHKNGYYIVETTYSNLSVSKTPEENNFTNTVDQILSTFKFTE